MISSNSTVLLSDLTKKQVENLEVGDKLINSDLGVSTVTFVETQPYKNKLRILSFESNRNFCWAESSTFFVEQNRTTTFWVEHPAVLLFQINYLKINSSVIGDSNKIAGEYTAKFATTDGFVRQNILDVTERYLDNNTLWLTRIETDSYAPIIVENFLYIPVVNDRDYDYGSVSWSKNSAELSHRLIQS